MKFYIVTENDNGSGMEFNSKEEFLKEISSMIDGCIANGGTSFGVSVDSDASCFFYDVDVDEDDECEEDEGVDENGSLFKSEECENSSPIKSWEYDDAMCDYMKWKTRLEMLLDDENSDKDEIEEARKIIEKYEAVLFDADDTEDEEDENEYDPDEDFLSSLADEAAEEDQIEIWLDNLLNATNKTSIDELTAKELLAEMDEVVETINIEKIWAKSDVIHEENVRHNVAYLKKLADLLDARMKFLRVGDVEFEIVDEVPLGYSIWNIGHCMPEGYLPFCRLSSRQEWDGAQQIETETLKAIKCEGAQIILAAIGSGVQTIEEMERYIEENRNAKPGTVAYAEVQKFETALPYMKKIKWPK